jgi:hypothetical protein
MSQYRFYAVVKSPVHKFETGNRSLPGVSRVTAHNQQENAHASWFYTRVNSGKTLF